MKKILLAAFILFACTLQAQIKVRFELTDKSIFSHDSIFIAGSFNNWDEKANTNYLLYPLQSKQKSITLSLKPGTYRYKFHRGNWISVEKTAANEEVIDREIKISRDTVLKDQVFSWRDEFLKEKWQLIAAEKQDTQTVKYLSAIASYYAFDGQNNNIDSAGYYANKCLNLIAEIKKRKETSNITVNSLNIILFNTTDVSASLFHSLGNYTKALELRFENLALAEKLNEPFQVFWALQYVTNEYAAMKDYETCLVNAKRLDSVVQQLKNSQYYEFAIAQVNSLYATTYLGLNKPKLAINHARTMLQVNPKILNEGNTTIAQYLLGKAFLGTGQFDSSRYYLKLARDRVLTKFVLFRSQVDIELSRVFLATNKLDLALTYGRAAYQYFLTNASEIRRLGESALYFQSEVTPILSKIFKARNNTDSAYYYLSLSNSLKDSLYNKEKITQFQNLSFNESVRKKQLADEEIQNQKAFRTKLVYWGLGIGLAGFLLISIIQFRNNQQKQKANRVLETTLTELKSTQSQLIQSEKMASLGELTAGIAHEIQNPLNFVNNFSEVSREFIDELKQERVKEEGVRDKVLEEELLSDIDANLEKINHHGQRAASIVKGMLQHSRSSSATKELTDINALCDEYLRLAYHGLRAKDKSFNAAFKTEFDESIPKVNIVPQDMGRVVLNLINNAFFAVSQRQNVGTSEREPNDDPTIRRSDEEYTPMVIVSTRKKEDTIEITVSDNGTGIPNEIKEKIFQPFFTTKPTGQGTGLGLSLAYDIVTKAHGGKLTVESEQGRGTTFKIEIP
ncbi:MAG: hypothetical protein K2X37_14385 [Chitinophagaceae bacterium]|nr:hypothetical protein [Chitinophagaceae bacterium]